jgi:acetolactate decarboxylase
MKSKDRNTAGRKLSLPSDLNQALEKAAAGSGESWEEIVLRAIRRHLDDRTTGNAVYLTAPVNSLVLGYYRQNTPIGEIRRHGDFGLGTFNNLDGEMVVLDGEVYQVKADGAASPVSDSEESPFACVTFFAPDSAEEIDGQRLNDKLENLLDGLIPSANMLYAIRIDGRFEYVKTRSVPRQENYRPLVEVARRQPVFEFQRIEGTLCGFYTPRFMASLNVPGYHLHFLTGDRHRGGHLLECRLEKVTVSLQHVPKLELGLPLTLDYLTADLSGETEQDLERAES